jgi:hypothetical protein
MRAMIVLVSHGDHGWMGFYQGKIHRSNCHLDSGTDREVLFMRALYVNTYCVSTYRLGRCHHLCVWSRFRLKR